MHKEIKLDVLRVLKSFDDTVFSMCSHFNNLEKRYSGIDFIYHINGVQFIFYRAFSKKDVRNNLDLNPFIDMFFLKLGSSPKVKISTFLLEELGMVDNMLNGYELESVYQQVLNYRNIDYISNVIYMDNTTGNIVAEFDIFDRSNGFVFEIKRKVSDQNTLFNEKSKLKDRCGVSSNPTVLVTVFIENRSEKSTIQISVEGQTEKDKKTLNKLFSKKLLMSNPLTQEVIYE